jgi:hypothetical protein
MKYTNQLVDLTNCPPSNNIYSYDTAYRFVFEPLDSRSFIPQGIKSPSRISNPNNNNHTKCSLFSLSMFISENDAVNRYEALKKICKNIDKSLGTHLAVGTLNVNDGLQYRANNDGHFDFHEHACTNLAPQFSIVKAL